MKNFIYYYLNTLSLDFYTQYTNLLYKYHYYTIKSIITLNNIWQFLIYIPTKSCNTIFTKRKNTYSILGHIPNSLCVFCFLFNFYM